MTWEGHSVAVKVRRPKIRKQVRADCDIVLTLAERLERTTDWAQRIRIGKFACRFVDSLQGELDCRGQLAHIEALRQADEAGRSASKTDSAVHIPHVYKELSGEYVIVMELVEGVPLPHGAEVLDHLSKIARREIAEVLFLMVVRQVLGRGIFHADRHPGNIVVSSTGPAGPVNFGAVGRIDERDRRAIALLLRGRGFISRCVGGGACSSTRRAIRGGPGCRWPRVHASVYPVLSVRAGTRPFEGRSDRAPLAVRVAPMSQRMTSRLVNGRPRQLMEMREKSRCSILFHFDVPSSR